MIVDCGTAWTPDSPTLAAATHILWCVPATPAGLARARALLDSDVMPPRRPSRRGARRHGTRGPTTRERALAPTPRRRALRSTRPHPAQRRGRSRRTARRRGRHARGHRTRIGAAEESVTNAPRPDPRHRRDRGRRGALRDRCRDRGRARVSRRVARRTGRRRTQDAALRLRRRRALAIRGRPPRDPQRQVRRRHAALRRPRAATDDARPPARRPAARGAAHVQRRGRRDRDRRLRHARDHRDGNPPAGRVRRALARRRRIHAGMQAAAQRPRARRGRDGDRAAARRRGRARDLRLDRSERDESLAEGAAAHARARLPARAARAVDLRLDARLGAPRGASTSWATSSPGRHVRSPDRKPEVLDTAQHTAAGALARAPSRRDRRAAAHALAVDRAARCTAGAGRARRSAGSCASAATTSPTPTASRRCSRASPARSGRAGTSDSGAAATTSPSRSTGSPTARSASRSPRPCYLGRAIKGPLEDLYPDVELDRQPTAHPPGRRPSCASRSAARSCCRSRRTATTSTPSPSRSSRCSQPTTTRRPSSSSSRRRPGSSTGARAGCSRSASARSSTPTTATPASSASTPSSKPRSSRARSSCSTARSCTSTCASSASDPTTVKRVAGLFSQLRSENELGVRYIWLRRRLYARRTELALPNPIPGWRTGVLSTSELATLWQLPRARVKHARLPRATVRRAIAPPEIERDAERDPAAATSAGRSRSRPTDRKYGHALIGGQGGGKSSVMARHFANDVRDPEPRRDPDRPEGAARRALPRSGRPPAATVHYLDLGRPEVGINPLTIKASPGARAAVFLQALDRGQPPGRDPGRVGLVPAPGGRRRLRRRAAADALARLPHARLRQDAELPRHVVARLEDRRRRRLRAVLLGREFPALVADRGYAAQALNPPRNKIERLISTREIDTLLRHPVGLDLDGDPRARRGPDRRRRQGQRRRGQHDPRHAAAAAAPPPRAAGPARTCPRPSSAGVSRCSSTRPTTCSRRRSPRCSPRADRPASRPSSRGSTPRRSATRSSAPASARCCSRSRSSACARWRTPARSPASRWRSTPTASPSTRRNRSGCASRPTTSSSCPIHRAINLWVADGVPRAGFLGAHAADGGPRTTTSSPSTTSTPSASAADITPSTCPTRSATAHAKPQAALASATRPRRGEASRQRARAAAASAATSELTFIDGQRRTLADLELMLPAQLHRAASATTAPRSTATARTAIVPCAIQPRDVAIVRDVWRYKFLTATQLLELHWPGCAPRVGQQAPHQALRRRPPRALPTRSRAPAARSPGPTSSARRATACCSETAHLDRRARFAAAHGLRLPLRPARAPPQRLGPRLAAAARTALLAWEGETEIEPPAEVRKRAAAPRRRSQRRGPARRRGRARPTRRRRSRSRDARRRHPQRSSSSTTAPGASTRTSRSSCRYDAFLCWWWRDTELRRPRRRRRSSSSSARTTTSASRSSHAADRELTGHSWHPSDGARGHEYAGATSMLFAVEVDMHRGDAGAWRVPPFPSDHPQRQAETRPVAVELPVSSATLRAA